MEHPKQAQSGVDLIAAERRRQVEQEGFTPEHDDTYQLAELPLAAAAYTTADVTNGHHYDAVRLRRAMLAYWPWDVGWWKPSLDPIRNLVKAGALICAEIDRLQRAAGRKGEQTEDGK